MATAEPLKHDGPADYGTRERWLKGDVVTVGLESERLQIAKATIECRLDWYERRALISERQHEAGMRVRHMFRRAVLPASTTGSYGPAVSGGGDMADTADARQRLTECLLGAELGKLCAVREQFQVLLVNGQQLYPDFLPLRLTPRGHVVLAVCGHDDWAGGTQRLMRLRRGLGDLADYWKLEG